MRLWHLDPSPSAVPVAADAVGELFSADAQASAAQCMLGFFNRVVPVDYLTLVEYQPDPRSSRRVPELTEGHARQGVRNVAPACFALYRAHFWRHDNATQVAERLAEGTDSGVAAMHLDASDIQLSQWREEIYDRAGLAARLNLLFSSAPDRVFAVNLYRGRARGGFAEAEICRLLDLAGLVRTAHVHALRFRREADGARAERVVAQERALMLLAARFPDLSARELAICARIACGMSADGIAADLGIASSSVATLRKRAYSKLAARGFHGGRMCLARMVG